MKRVYINGRFLTQPLSGMQRFAGEMVTAIDLLLSEDKALASRLRFEVLLPRGPRRAAHWRNIPVTETGRLKGHAWEQVELAWAARDGILVNLAAAGPLAHRRSVLVLHDAAIFAHPEHFSLPYRSLHRFLRPRLARAAARLATISEFSRRELAKWCGVSESAFAIIGDSAEHILDEAADTGILERHGLVPGRYALTVGNQSPNKNIALALSAFVESGAGDWLLAVAGGGSDKIFGGVAVDSHPAVRRLGRVSDGELRALYENAGMFLFPSRYEGFGVPPLEAMILGCPVISADATAMPEVLGDAAVYFRSDDSNDLARQISDLRENGELRAALAAAGKQRASDFSWRKSAGIMVGLLDGLER